MPVPCCHLLSLVVTDIENVMHTYFGMTWKEREATVSQTAWSSTPADTSSKSPLAVRAAVGKLQKQRSYSEIGFSTAGIAGIDFERHPGWGRDCHRDSLQRSHSDVSHDGDFAKQEPSYRARHHGDNEQISDATVSELSATQVQSHAQVESVMDVTERRHDDSGLGESCTLKRACSCVQCRRP